MKKKVLAILLATSMLALCLNGCTLLQQEKPPMEVTVGSEETEESESSEKLEVSVAVSEEPEEESSFVTVEIFEEAYDSYTQANDDYIFVERDDKYGLINIKGEVVMPLEYDGYGAMMQDGCFCLGKKTSDSTWESYIYDKDLNIIFSNEGYEKYIIASYNEGYIQLKEYNPADGIRDYIYISDDNFEVAFTITPETVSGLRGASGVNNGVVMVQSFTYANETAFPIAVDTNGIQILGPDHWAPFAFAQTDSGYINGLIFSEETGKSLWMAVYNTKTEKMVNLPEEIITTKTFSANGVIVTATEDGYLTVQKEENGPLAIYSLEKQEYVTDYKYGVVDLFNHDKEEYILVANEDESKWGYLDKDMNEVGTWYTDATDFNNGKAIIQDTDGLCYVVDTSFNKISEGFEAEAAYALDSMDNCFGILKDGKYYMVILHEE